MRSRVIAAVLCLQPFAAVAETIPEVSVEKAYTLIRETMLDFQGSPDDLLNRFSSVSDGVWDHTPLMIDYPADPQALRLSSAMEMDAEGNANLNSRQLECTRLGAAGLAAVLAQEPIAPELQPGAPAPSFDIGMMEGMALPALVYAASEVAPEARAAVMMCTMTIALLPEDAPEETLKALISPDFAKVETVPEGAISFIDGLEGTGSYIGFMRISVPKLESGARFLYVTAFSVEVPPES